MTTLPTTLARLRALIEAATPGEWGAEDTYDAFCGNPYCTQDGCPESHPSGRFAIYGPEFDGDYLSAGVPALVNETDGKMLAAFASPDRALAWVELVEAYEEVLKAFFAEREANYEYRNMRAKRPKPEFEVRMATAALRESSKRWLQEAESRLAAAKQKFEGGGM